MLSRSNSNAGERLRRAKSTSSTHTSSTAHLRTSTSTDPFVTRQQAEVAAIEAYQRALQSEEPSSYPTSHRPAPPKLQRRRSQNTGKTEGSHLEDARLGRRRSNIKRDGAANAKSASGHRDRQDSVIEAKDGDEVVVVRRRSVIPPISNAALSQGVAGYSVPSTTGWIPRKSQSTYSDGSPEPRTAAVRRGTNTAIRGSATHEQRLGGSDNRLSDIGVTDNAPTCGNVTSTLNVQGTETNAEAIASARDKCLQDFHHGRLRERKSFILAPFQKRRATDSEKSSMSRYDTTLPPYNFADEGMSLPAPLQTPGASVSVVSRTAEEKSGSFSSSLKSRFRKAFRKTSRVVAGLPAQHVEAKHFHYPIEPGALIDVADHEMPNDPLSAEKPSDCVLSTKTRANCAESTDGTDEQSLAKSRTTSWTTSTVAGTWSTRNPPDPENLISDYGRLKRSDSMSTLRKASSFFGRPIRSKLRRPSKADLQSSGESIGLYSALQERIGPEHAAKETLATDTPESSRRSDRASLPSQQPNYTSTSSRTHWARAPTIRSVTPDPGIYKLDIPSPVAEVLSPAPAHAGSHGQSPDEEQSEPTPCSRLQRRPAIKAPMPSNEQIARRIERSQNRWQSPLEDLSPPVPRTRRAAMTGDNPYVLGSLNRALQQPMECNDLPHHAKVGKPPITACPDAMSPSVYSCGTDDETPQADLPGKRAENMVTITSHEVRSYSISPPKRHERALQTSQGSQDWRRWLSQEIGTWGTSSVPEDLSLSEFVVEQQPISNKDNRQFSLAGPSCQDSPAATSHGHTAGGGVTHRRARKRSSFMNERYPMMDSRPISGAQSANLDFETLLPAELELSNQQSVASIEAPSAGDRYGRTVHNVGHRSTENPQLESRREDPSTLPQAAGDLPVKTDGSTQLEKNNRLAASFTDTQDMDQKKAHKPRSAFELRASYKTNTFPVARPIEVRRQSARVKAIDILEDMSIQNISAGPYASQRLAAIDTATEVNKENTPPPAEGNGLPALSSSEWLAAGTNKKREARYVSNGRRIHRDRSVSRCSPSTVPTVNRPAGGSSPGHRMASNWLDGRRSKENSPLFV